MSFTAKLKKMKANFDAAKENFSDAFGIEIPAGVYNFKLTRFELGETSNETLAVFKEQVVMEGEHKGAVVRDMFAVENEFGLKKLLYFLDQLGTDVEKMSATDLETICPEIEAEEAEYKAKLKYSKSGYANLEIMEVFGEEAGDDDGEEVDYSELSLDELIAECNEREIKVPKKAKAKELVKLLEEYDDENAEDDNTDDAEDAAENDESAPTYEDMTTKELVAECKERGIEIPKKYKDKDLIALLEAYDEENGEGAEDETAEADEEVDYTEMELEELEAMCKERKIKVPKKYKKKDLIALLEEDDAEESGDDGEEAGDDDEDGITEKLIEFASVRGIDVKDDMTREQVIKILKEYDYEAKEMDADEIELFKEAGIDNLIEGLAKPKATPKKK